MNPARVTRTALWTVLWATAISNAWIRPAHAIPNIVTVSGFVEDGDGRPLEGAFLYEISFYELEFSTTSIDTLTSATSLTAGVFSIPVEMPPEVIVLDEVWYSLAIDVDHDGLDVMDLFDDRFQITSVPFALSGAQAPFFFTHAGVIPGFAGSINRGDTPHLHIAPFITPAGGVEFNRMSAFLRNGSGGSVKCSFGIYNAAGELVATSGEINLPESVDKTLVVDVSGRLRPSSLYYTGLGSNRDGLGTFATPVPPVPNVGLVRNVVVGGIIPNSFDPSMIDPRVNGHTIIGIGLLR